MKIKVIIVDDEVNGRENLRGVLSKFCPEVEVLCEATSAIEAITAIQQHQPDLVFLDIEMPGGNGFEVLDFFKQPDFGVIFVTAYDQYAIHAIKFSALDYILKPIDALGLKAAINRYIEQKEIFDSKLQQFMRNTSLERGNKKIALAFADKIDFIEVRHIVKCVGEANYTHVFLDTKKEICVTKSLIEYEEILGEYGFIRTHKTHIVNLEHITTYIKKDGGYLIMSDGSSVPVSRRKKDFVLEKLKNQI